MRYFLLCVKFLHTDVVLLKAAIAVAWGKDWKVTMSDSTKP